MAVPGDAWKPGVRQDGTTEDDKEVTEITHLLSRAGNWPDGLRWIARRVKPSRWHLKNLTAYEDQAGWKYSITCTNIPDAGVPGVPGSHHPQFVDVLHPRPRQRRDPRRPDCEGHGPAQSSIEDLAGQQRMGPRSEHRR